MTQEPQSPSKKPTSPWIWVIAGCGGLTVLAVLVVVAVVGFGMFKARDFLGDMEENPVRAVAQLAIDRDPNLEIVDSDDADGTFTVRDLRTGEVVTLNFQDIADGKLTVTTGEGEMTMEATPSEEGGGITVTTPEGQTRIGADASLEDVPDWVPLPPDATETSGTFQTTSSDGVAGMVALLVQQEPREVLDWFKEWFEKEGYESGGETFVTSPEGAFGAVTGHSADTGRTVSVTVAETEEGTGVTINYNQET